MKIATIVVMLLVGMVTQSCRIEMPSLVNLMAEHYRGNIFLPRLYDFTKSTAITMQGGFKDTLLIGDIMNGHGHAMRRNMNDMGVPREHTIFFSSFVYFSNASKNNKGLEEIVSSTHERLREATRVVHIPYVSPLDGPQDSARVASIENVMFVTGTGNSDTGFGDRDRYKSSHPYWRSRGKSYQNVLRLRGTKKVIFATSARVKGGKIIPYEEVSTCGDIKEICFTIIPQQLTSPASSRLAAMTFYLSQLYPTEEEVRETLEKCVVDIGEPGIDREYGRGIANLLCPRVLEREVEIVSNHVEEAGNPFLSQGGDIEGTWEAQNTPLKVYLPEALKETLQPHYSNTGVRGTLRAVGNSVEARFSMSARVSVNFLMSMSATVTDVVRAEGNHSENMVTLDNEIYTYTVKEDSLFLVKSLTFNEALALLPEPIGNLTGSLTKNLFANNPITITMEFSRKKTEKKELAADFNRNGTVGIADFLLFTDVFGSREGDATYNPDMDLDNNGTIGISDFLIFVDQFGKTV